MVEQLAALQAQLQEQCDYADSPANVSNPVDGIANRTDINAASGSRGAEQRASGHENPSSTDGETQKTGDMDNVPSPAG